MQTRSSNYPVCSLLALFFVNRWNFPTRHMPFSFLLLITQLYKAAKVRGGWLLYTLWIALHGLTGDNWCKNLDFFYIWKHQIKVEIKCLFFFFLKHKPSKWKLVWHSPVTLRFSHWWPCYLSSNAYILHTFHVWSSLVELARLKATAQQVLPSLSQRVFLILDSSRRTAVVVWLLFSLPQGPVF